jgi:hypothetical protein
MLLADVQEPMTVLRDRPENHLPLNKETHVIMSYVIDQVSTSLPRHPSTREQGRSNHSHDGDASGPAKGLREGLKAPQHHIEQQGMQS